MNITATFLVKVHTIPYWNSFGNLYFWWTQWGPRTSVNGRTTVNETTSKICFTV
nr:hypothetical protein Itr_chr01CG12380 [Ipomoea trifida]